ncbi:MAG: hypothetical protein IJY61_05170 [Candidatus Gastranaerophilales bacterium]|nr:hypothetical protein [Candidatus Gastranaerophilales bacterium]
MNVSSVMPGVEEALKKSLRKQKIQKALVDTAIVGGVLGSSSCISKVSGNPVGAPASLAHILTNDKLDMQGKAKVLAEQFTESTKDTLKLGVATAGIGGITALAYAKLPKAAEFLNEAKTGIAEMLSNVSLGNKNLKDIIKSTKIFEKVSKLPAPAKAAAGAAAVALSIVTPLFLLVQSQKAGYIEGKNETK